MVHGLGRAMGIVSAVGVLLVLAGCPAAGEEQPPSDGIDFRKTDDFWGGNFGAFAADACVLKLGDNEYRKYYTGLDMPSPEEPEGWSSAICLALSENGREFINPTSSLDMPAASDERPFAVLAACDEPQSWEQKIETCFVVPTDDGYYLYYGGYRRGGAPVVDDGAPIDTMGAELGLAVSSGTSSGLAFERYGSTARDHIVLERTVESPDEDAIFSPSIVRADDTFYMIYTGHRYSHDATVDQGVVLMGATSTDGVKWTKHEASPVMVPASHRAPDDPAHDYAWMEWGVAEAHLIHGPDGRFYLFFQGMAEDAGHTIGVARGDHPFGPWEIYPEPILRPTSGTPDEDGVIAPHVLFDGDTVRLYYNALHGDSWLIGYAECRWPFWPE
ncbi:MAG: hypothetical protein ACOC0O_04025 [Spirochaetota bacterium]